MNTALLILALAPLAPSAEFEPGLQLAYEGKLVAERETEGASEKSFRLSVLVQDVRGSTATLLWTLSEQGGGGWSWVHRFGKLESAAAETVRPTLLYERPQGASIVALHPPLLLGRELQVGAAWKEAEFDHRVTRETRASGQEAWEVEVRNAYGLKRRLLVAKQSPVVLALEENVFIGQGERHQLRYELVTRQPLEPATLEATNAAFERFLGLREQLGIAAETREIVWTDERLAQLRAALPEIVKSVPEGPLTQIAQAAQSDAQEQKNRAGAVAFLRGKLIGKAAPQPALSDLTNQPFDWKSRASRVTVLHFWDYQDAPLEEPYGQVAYLDFLYRNRKSSDVEIVGVAVHERLADPDTRSRAVQSVKKLRSFMNLSYPQLLDFSDGVGAFGDPRVTGAKLPLFVVIGRDGTVTHYHVGTYEVDRDRGLEELEKVIAAALAAPG